MPNVKLHDDGWLALPISLRKQLDLNTGDWLDAELIDGKLVLRPSRGEARPAAPEPEPAAATPTTQLATPAGKRGPGRPRKAELASPALPTPEPKRARGRPRKIAAPQAAAPVTTVAISESPKLVKKADLPVATSVEEQLPPPSRRSLRLDTGAAVVERRPFRQVEVRKLGPGRGHSRNRLSPAYAGQAK